MISPAKEEPSYSVLNSPVDVDIVTTASALEGASSTFAQDSIEEVVSSVSEEETVVDIHSPPRCRMCFDDDGELIDLGCACKDKLLLAHEDCAQKWFKIKKTPRSVKSART